MKKLPLILLLVLVGVFLFGLTQLFKLRFQAGDIYPEYSSLRADPLGTKAFYESLDNLLAAGRNFRPLSKLGDGCGRTLFYLGSRATFTLDAKSDLKLQPEEFNRLESFVRDGGRLVISFFPSFQRPSTNRFAPKSAPSTPVPAGNDKTKANGPTVTTKKGPLGEDDRLENFRTVSIQERWGMDYNYDELLKDDNHVYRPAPAIKMDPAKGLPDVISCHTALFFDNLTNSWRVVYARKKGRPVIIERKLGAGTIILCADSYLFSNEALLKERSPELLAWMVGPSHRVLFDETHLGVEETPGISALARKYRLHGLFVGLLLLAGLFVWRNSTSFMPPYEEEVRRLQGELVAGKDSAAGFVNLLRRNLSAGEVLAVGLAEWKKSCSRGHSKAKLQQMQVVIDLENARTPGERDAVRTYQAISNILAKSSELVSSSERLYALPANIQLPREEMLPASHD